jgi:hypothetical protein
MKMAKLMNAKREKVGEIYLTQEINAMRVGCSAHFETEPELNKLLGLTQENAPGFSYLYADGRIVRANEGNEQLVGYWEK